MKEGYACKVYSIGNSIAIHLPSQIAKLLKIKAGDKLKLSIWDGKLVYEKDKV